MRRDTRKLEVVSQSISELQHYHRHAEGQSHEFQQSQAELRQHLGRSNTEGAQLMNLCEETRIANGRIAPKVGRVHQNLRDAESRDGGESRINDLVNQIQITRVSMNLSNQGLAQQSQTSILKFLICELRWCGNQSTENRDAEKLRNLKNFSLCR